MRKIIVKIVKEEKEDDNIEFKKYRLNTILKLTYAVIVLFLAFFSAYFNTENTITKFIGAYFICLLGVFLTNIIKYIFYEMKDLSNDNNYTYTEAIYNNIWKSISYTVIFLLLFIITFLILYDEYNYINKKIVYILLYIIELPLYISSFVFKNIKVKLISKTISLLLFYLLLFTIPLIFNLNV